MCRRGASARTRAIARQVVLAIATLFAISAITFAGTNIKSPTDVARNALGRFADKQQLAVYAKDHGLDPRLSPVNHDLRGLAPTLIQVGSTEVLRVDAELMAERLAEAGVPVRLQVWNGQIHDFQIGNLPESRAAVEEIGSFVRAAMMPDAARLARGGLEEVA